MTQKTSPETQKPGHGPKIPGIPKQKTFGERKHRPEAAVVPRGFDPDATFKSAGVSKVSKHLRYLHSVKLPGLPRSQLFSTNTAEWSIGKPGA